MAHVEHRDPVVGIGQGAAIQLVLGVLLGGPDLTVLGSAGLYTQLHFTREMERAADAEALAAVHGLYGHVDGADGLFRVIHDYRDGVGRAEVPAIFSSHPLDQQRIDAIRVLAQARGWAMDGEPTPLPPDFARWLNEAAARAEEAAGDAAAGSAT